MKTSQRLSGTSDQVDVETEREVDDAETDENLRVRLSATNVGD